MQCMEKPQTTTEDRHISDWAHSLLTIRVSAIIHTCRAKSLQSQANAREQFMNGPDSQLRSTDEGRRSHETGNYCVDRADGAAGP